jgi:hypothetical protein
VPTGCSCPQPSSAPAVPRREVLSNRRRT